MTRATEPAIAAAAAAAAAAPAARDDAVATGAPKYFGVAQDQRNGGTALLPALASQPAASPAAPSACGVAIVVGTGEIMGPDIAAASATSAAATSNVAHLTRIALIRYPGRGRETPQSGGGRSAADRGACSGTALTALPAVGRWTGAGVTGTAFRARITATAALDGCAVEPVLTLGPPSACRVSALATARVIAAIAVILVSIRARAALPQ